MWEVASFIRRNRTATTESGFTVIAHDRVRGLFPELLDLFRELPAAVSGEEPKNSPKFHVKLTMKTDNILPLKKLALLTAAFCTAIFACSHNASATPKPLPPAISLTIGDTHELGKVFFGEPSGDANRTAYVNAMIGLSLGGSTHVDYSPPAFQNNLVTRSNNDFGPLPQPAVLALNGTGTSVDLGDGTLYSYLFAKYDGKNGGCEVWYVGGLSGDITIPAFAFGPPGTTKYALSGWTLFGPGVPGVPDGGATVMLLGTALGALGIARRFLTS
jgi:hypothetical protein